MSLDLSIIGQPTELGRHEWSRSDTMLYALAVGCGPDDLRFVTEGSVTAPAQVFPTFSTIVERRRSYRELGDIALSQLLHAGQTSTLHAPFPVEGAATTTSTVTDVFDTGRHALVVAEAVIRDDSSGDLLATNRRTLFVRDEGGFGGPPPPEPGTRQLRPPDLVVEFATRPDQALLYRLTGDRNPLHSDPDAARRAGFDRPILHGLCTLAMAVRSLTIAAGQDVSRIGSLEGRFRAPVVPGESVTVTAWRSPVGFSFEAHVGDRLVLGSCAVEGDASWGDSDE